MPKPEGPLPKNWPSNVTYITTPSYSRIITETHLSALHSPAKDIQDIPASTPKGPCSLVRITPITSPAHPACGQSGLFAARDLKPGSFILQYLGEVHGPSLSSSSAPDPYADSDYDLSLDRELGIGIDADRKGNEARFINDYRGVAERANAEFKEVWDERRKEKGMGVWVLGEGKSGKGKGVKKGEEILVSYGRGFWGARKADDVE